MTLYRQENPILESSDEDFAFAEEETFSQNKYLDIFTFFAFLNDPVQLAAKLRYYNILKSTVRCSGSGCRREMKAERTADVSDGYVWRCGFCRKKKSIRATSYFEQSKLPLKKSCIISLLLGIRRASTRAGKIVRGVIQSNHSMEYLL